MRLIKLSASHQRHVTKGENLTSSGTHEGFESKASTFAPRDKANFTTERPDTPNPITCNRHSG